MTALTALTTLAALLSAAAVALLVPVRLGSVAGTRGSVRRLGGRRVAAGLSVVAGGLLATVQGQALALALIVLAALAGAALLVRGARSNRAAQRRQRRVVEVAEALVGELRAGQPLVGSLQHCVEVWPELEPVAAAAALGADVPAALRRLGQRPGAEGCREIGAAWQVSQQSGAGLATALAQVAGTARERQATSHLVQGELASAQATARLVAVLPVASLAMSSGIGGDPWHFLLATTPGLACLALGLLFAFAGLLWIDRIAAGVLRG